MSVSERFYCALLHLYPESHRREYGEWMAQAFRDQCRAARQDGLWGWLALWWRTLTDAAETIVIEHLESGKKVAMRNLFAKTNEPGTWLEAFAAAVPFIIYGALGILYALNANGFMPYPGPLGLSYNVWIVMIGNVVTAVVLAIGWIQGFPRWSYTALLPLWFYYNYLSNMWSGTRPPIDGIRVWLPVVIVLGYPLYRTRSLRPLWAFISGI
ncbi:MAG: hypothetical protein K8I60_06055 [Anaerolineae bacterium]|nr:hypothetical protein [Anaerolineae bacterium]